MTKTDLTALVIDDEKGIRSSLLGILEDEGWQGLEADCGQQGIELFRKHRPKLVLLDVWMPGIDGIETLQHLKALDDKTPVVIMSGHGSIDTAVRATKLGAFEYLEKPLSLDKIIPLLEQAESMAAKDEESTKNKGKDNFATEMIGESPQLNQIKIQIAKVAPRNAWVLITGENGTGKEVVARQIHRQSARSKKPFIAVNCAAIPEELIESELFGYNKGAFTNATTNKQGRFELANQGTLFLDEIGDMSLKTQAKILRILQEQRFERVGGVEAIEVDVRVVAATNKNLETEIAAGRFREDLFYRLNVVPFKLPPLRERLQDLPHLAEHFLSQIAKEMQEPVKQLEEDSLLALSSYRWPGNIRELKNFLERLCIMVAETKVKSSHLINLLPSDRQISPTTEIDYGNEATTLKQAKTDFERRFIIDKLEEYDWNITKTAEAIGVERSNLHKKLKSFGIDPKQRSQ